MPDGETGHPPYKPSIPAQAGVTTLSISIIVASLVCRVTIILAATLARKCLRQQRVTYTVMYMVNDVMIRTQVYLSREQEQALKSLAITSGTRQSELIREAVDLFLSKRNALQSQWKKALQDMKGIWADEESMEERMDEIRQEFDR